MARIYQRVLVEENDVKRSPRQLCDWRGKATVMRFMKNTYNTITI
jgi:hypothetical protein